MNNFLKPSEILNPNVENHDGFYVKEEMDNHLKNVAVSYKNMLANVQNSLEKAQSYAEKAKMYDDNVNVLAKLNIQAESKLEEAERQGELIKNNLIQEGTQDVTKMTEDAQMQVNTVLHNAQSDAQKIVNKAVEDSERLMTSAEEKSNEIINSAKKYSADIINYIEDQKAKSKNTDRLLKESYQRMQDALKEFGMFLETEQLSALPEHAEEVQKESKVEQAPVEHSVQTSDNVGVASSEPTSVASFESVNSNSSQQSDTNQSEAVQNNDPLDAFQKEVQAKIEQLNKDNFNN